MKMALGGCAIVILVLLVLLIQCYNDNDCGNEVVNSSSIPNSNNISLPTLNEYGDSFDDEPIQRVQVNSLSGITIGGKGTKMSTEEREEIKQRILMDMMKSSKNTNQEKSKIDDDDFFNDDEF